MGNRSSPTKPLFTEKEKSKMSPGNLLGFSCCFDDVLFVEVINYNLWNCLLPFICVLWRKQSVYAGLSTLALQQLPACSSGSFFKELWNQHYWMPKCISKKKKRGLTAHVVIPPGKFKMQYTCSESGKVSEYVTNSCTALGPPTIYEQHRERWSSTAEQLMERGQKEMWDLSHSENQLHYSCDLRYRCKVKQQETQLHYKAKRNTLSAATLPFQQSWWERYHTLSPTTRYYQTSTEWRGKRTKERFTCVFCL